jgi:hypothetical protein
LRVSVFAAVRRPPVARPPAETPGLGITIVGGLIVSQMLTLFTTPVVYLFFDRLQWRFMKLHRIGAELEDAPAD